MFNSTVEAVFHYADIQPDKLCLVDDESSVSYRQYADKILQYAGRFSRLGIVANDKVVVEACQTIDYLSIGLALQLVGAIFTPVEHNCATEKICSFASNLKQRR